MSEQGAIDARMHAAVAAHQAGRLDEASAIYREVLSHCPGFPDARHLLGLVHFQRGEWPLAEEEIRGALQARPEVAMFWFNLGNVLREAGKPDAAIEAFGRAADLDPNLAGARVNRANLLRESDRHVEALADYDRVLALFPQDDRALDGAALCRKKMGQVDEAERLFRRAVAINPGATISWVNLARLLADGPGTDEALSIIRRLLARGGLASEPMREAGSVLARLGKNDEALACFDACLSANPGDFRARVSRADVLMRSWRHDEAWADYRFLLEQRPADADCWQSIISFQMYFGRIAPEALCELHRWYETLTPKYAALPRVDGGSRASSRVRLGFISPDFRRHSCAHFLWPLVNALDPGRFEIFFYANVGRPDDMTERFRLRADHWRDLRFLSGSRLASLIRSDGLDVLVDLAGHTDGGMMALLASRLAPIQLTWLGYPATTGLSAMDYRLTDEVADPPGASESHCTERLIRLPGGFLCFSALDSPPPGPSVEKAVDADLPVVFGSFNNLFKVTPEVLSLWAEIVLAVPDSQLVLKYVQFDDPGVRSRVAAFLGECGLPAERLVLRGPVPPREHLETYGSIDIALDPFPYNGTTTTCEALYMGVPVVTLRGDSHVSRVGASILTTIGCQELIANDPAAYKRIAIELAGNPEHRRDLRKTLPARFRASPLFDAPGFARKFEAALDRMLDGENTLKDRPTQ